jgi:multidrug efflux system membrane fusion protein
MKLVKSLSQLPKKKLYYAITAGIVGICVIGGVLWKQNNRQQIAVEDIPVVRIAVIGTTSAIQGYTYSGEVRGRYESQLAFQASGKIIKRNIQLGSTVSVGDVLMQIDAKDVAQTVNNYTAQVDSAESRLQLAESDLKRYRELLNAGAVSQSQYDQYANAYNVAAAGVRQAQAQYMQGSHQMDYTLLTADKPGVISSISAEIGQVVSAGQTIVTIVQDGEREVEISVPENRIEELRAAPQLTVSFWALSKLTVDGKIREIAPMADQTTRTFKVRVSLLNLPPEVKLGMTATVTVVGSNIPQTVTIPLPAIYQESGNTPAVWVVKDDVLALRSVTVGNFGNGTVEVLGGLQPGDRIVTAGVHKLKDGQKVKVGGDSL